MFDIVTLFIDPDASVVSIWTPFLYILTPFVACVTVKAT